MASSGTSPAGPSWLQTFALIFAAMAVLFVADTFLARVEKSESRDEAERLIRQGQLLVQAGRNVEAIDRFRSALSVSRANSEAQLALAGALLAVGRLTDAEALLKEMLQRNATDGAANLVMARVLAKRGQATEASSYYHQAIYGRWKQESAANRVRVRFELIDLLVQQGASREVLAELLPLQDEAPNNLQTRKRIAGLYLAAGSPLRARDLFREILREQPQDSEAYAGLGEAEFARENYRLARSNFIAALRLKPEDEGISKRLNVCDTILALDPTGRGLSTAERYQRSMKLVELSLEAVSQCVVRPSSKPVYDLTNNAKQALKRRVGSSRQDAVTETNLELVEHLWQLRMRECREGPSDADEPLALVIARLAQ